MTQTDSKRMVEESKQLIEQIRPILAGHHPSVQGAALADLLAMFLAGHAGKGAHELRQELLAQHIKCVLDLIPINEAIIHHRAKR